MLAISSHASRTTSEPGAVAAEQPVVRRIREDVALRARVKCNEDSIVGWQYVPASVKRSYYFACLPDGGSAASAKAK